MKKPLYRAVVDLIRAKTQLSRVSQLHEKELFELGNLLRISQWRSPEDIVVATRLLRDTCRAVSPEGDTKAVHSFLEALIKELEMEATKLMPKPANCPRVFQSGIHE